MAAAFGQPVRIDKIRMHCADFPGSGIHLLRKCTYAPGNIDGEAYCHIIAAVKHHPVKELPDSKHFPLFQIQTVPSYAYCLFRHSDFLIEIAFVMFDRQQTCNRMQAEPRIPDNKDPGSVSGQAPPFYKISVS